MKTFYITLILITTSIVCKGQVSINCLPEKGISIAKTKLISKSEKDLKKTKNKDYQEVHYDRKGRVVLIKNSKKGTIHRREYKEGKLQFLISTRKKLPDFYSTEDLDSLMINAKQVTDTVEIKKHYPNGEITEIKYPNNTSQIFEFDNCSSELNIFLNSVGDTIQKHHIFFENGVIIKTIWTTFKPIKSDIVTEYYDYKFNRYGHWVRRKYKKNSGAVLIEKRKLIYYE